MSRFRNVVCAKYVETQTFCWGSMQWLSEPRVTGSPCMLTGIMILKAGKHQSRHAHPGISKNIFVLDGQCEITIEGMQGEEKHILSKGCLAHLQPGQFHWLGNVFGEDFQCLVTYEFSGPEAAMRADAGCKVTPPCEE